VAALLTISSCFCSWFSWWCGGKSIFLSAHKSFGVQFKWLQSVGSCLKLSCTA